MFRSIPDDMNPLWNILRDIRMGKPMLEIPGVRDSPETVKRLEWAANFEKKHGSLGFMRDYRPGQDAIRDWAVRRYAWAVPTEDVIHKICEVAYKHDGLLEVHAGSGYWANLIRYAADDHFPFVATDISPWDSTDPNHYGHVDQLFTHVEKEDAVKSAERAARNGWALLTVWPNYEDSWTGEMISAYVKHGGRTVIHVGEGNGGCTGGEWFWELLEHYFDRYTPRDHPNFRDVLTWSIAHDYLQIYTRDTDIKIEDRLHDANKYHGAIEEQRRSRRTGLEIMRSNLEKLNKDLIKLKGETICPKDSSVRSLKLVLAPPARRSKNRRLLIR